MTKPTENIQDKFTLSEQEALARNGPLLEQACELLYGTMILNNEAAKARGEALQAIERCALALGLPSILAEWERK